MNLQFALILCHSDAFAERLFAPIYYGFLDVRGRDKCVIGQPAAIHNHYTAHGAKKHLPVHCFPRHWLIAYIARARFHPISLTIGDGGDSGNFAASIGAQIALRYAKDAICRTKPEAARAVVQDRIDKGAA